MAEKLKFATMFSRNETVPAPTGTEYDKEYTMFIDETGHKILKCTGETNRYKKIQSFKDECLIENKLPETESEHDKEALTKICTWYPKLKQSEKQAVFEMIRIMASDNTPT